MGIQVGELLLSFILKADLPSGSGAESLTTGPISCTLTLKVYSSEALNCRPFVGKQMAPHALEVDFCEQSTVTCHFDADVEEDGSLTVGTRISQD
eukprot:NODE_7094_length_461_cov_457.394089.p2 GENE.NODE_7094_length_461_cov_457.394089~~NODE_7094_length_461_cov_457.394089.p2  ORF type:complete len:95 (+),score=25.44 NODE_7094_length_461_cov_457.394089:3-287(+)